jgi:hypothetical protein
MDVLSLLIQIVLFGAVAYGVWWVCQRFGMPPPVFWLCGVVLLIMLFMFLARQFGLQGTLPRR